MVDLYDAHSRRPSLIPRANTHEGVKRYDSAKNHSAQSGDPHGSWCRSHRQEEKPHKAALRLIAHPKAHSAKEKTRPKRPRAFKMF
jgi:hypothetical protein